MAKFKIANIRSITSRIKMTAQLWAVVLLVFTLLILCVLLVILAAGFPVLIGLATIAMIALGVCDFEGCSMRGRGDFVRHRHACAVLLAASTLAGLLAAPAASRASPDERDAPQPAGTPGPLVERALSELVLIETYVNDSRGRPLAGLTADDFILMVDGRK
ncbi:MAG TPA: hypothetical protein VEO37_10195, partial [Thermoanaerobaculia bacterium]|nr:hypothetical protein [Thermoanaerobaculia bacterium]